MASPVPASGKMLGRFQILKPLAKGGMAEVFLARTLGIKGFERHVVLKFMRVEHNANQKTLDMLLDEARLVASLHHRNIVQVHDVGQDDGKYFFAMEYVHGEDTRALLRKVKDKKQQIPLSHIITIITAAAAGLHYAHEQRGSDRKPLGIVHRDISPGNILLGFDGGVKVVDFGIAKTDKQTETQAGELKGKVGYMSPEQCKALSLDRRTDVYMLGIVLYELCTVRRLFKGDNRFDTMAQIVAGTIPPPSRFRKDLPDELERIILKALATDPEDRYQTADDLRLVLEAFATRSNFQISPSKLSDYLKELFGERPEPWLVDEPPPDPHDQPTAMMSAAAAMEAFAFDDAEGALTAKPSSPVLAVVATDSTPQAPASETAARSDGEPSTGDTPMAWSGSIDGADPRRRKVLIAAIGGAAVVVAILLFVMTRADDSPKRSAAPANDPKAQVGNGNADKGNGAKADNKGNGIGDNGIGHNGNGETGDSAGNTAARDAGIEVVERAHDGAGDAIEATPDAGVELATKPTGTGRPATGRATTRRPRPTATKPKPDKRKADKPKPDKPKLDKPKPDTDEDLDSPFPD